MILCLSLDQICFILFTRKKGSHLYFPWNYIGILKFRFCVNLNYLMYMYISYVFYWYIFFLS